MKHLALLFLLALLAFSCTENCCDDGELISPDDIEEVIDGNENGNLLFSALISGNLTCLNDNPLADVNVTVSDELGNTVVSQTDANGDFTFDNLDAGSYLVSFDNPILYSYTSAEYDVLIADLRDVILAVRPSTSADLLAYHFVNFEDGITTLDQVLFSKLQSGDMGVSEIDTPWRYITQEDLELENLSINSNLLITVQEDEQFALDVRGIHFGDPTGATCN